MPFDFGEFWTRGQSMGTGQAPVKRYNRYLMNLIRTGRAKPSWIVSHRLPLDQAAWAYEHFDARDEGWTKVVLRPELNGDVDLIAGAPATTARRAENQRR